MIEFMAQGLYTPQDVARILREEPRTIKRWAFGYEHQGKFFPPAIRTDVPLMDLSRVLTFLELVELLSIQGFLREGLSWRKVRAAAEVASRLLAQEPHPFARRDWFVDPAGLYLKLGREHDEDLLVEVAGDAQVAMEEALRPYLHQLRFGEDGFASRWYPRGPDQPIVLDPRRAYGAPIIEDGGVRTELLLDLHLAGDSVEQIASFFDVQEHEVIAAIEFEEAIAA
jgi:uncharacterized protein (DUF433 family)